MVLAGDLFDRWDPSPGLISFALDHLPPCYAVPGQHDLRNHSYEDLSVTAYWILVKTGLVRHLEYGRPCPVDGAVLWGFPWGRPPRPCEGHEPLGGFHVAVIHKYVCIKEARHPRASPESDASRAAPGLRGYQFGVYGDNHLPFRDGKVLNCGTFLRRKWDERDVECGVWLVHRSGKVLRHLLDQSGHCFEDRRTPKKPRDAGMDGLMRSLSGVEVGRVDFREEVIRRAEAEGFTEEELTVLREILTKGLEKET